MPIAVTLSPDRHDFRPAGSKVYNIELPYEIANKLRDWNWVMVSRTNDESATKWVVTSGHGNGKSFVTYIELGFVPNWDNYDFICARAIEAGGYGLFDSIQA
jgi:hypothetical protein